MRILVPLTGTVLEYDPEMAKLDGIGISGDPDDPIRLIEIDLGNVSWRLKSIDYENELAEIEVTPSQTLAEETGEVDEEGNPKHRIRPTTPAEKNQYLDNVQALLAHTRDELYNMSKSARLKKPFKG